MAKDYKGEALAMVLSRDGGLLVETVAELLEMLDAVPPAVAAVAREEILRELDGNLGCGLSFPGALSAHSPALLKAWVYGTPLKDALVEGQAK
jgi:hypothetical protein